MVLFLGFWLGFFFFFVFILFYFNKVAEFIWINLKKKDLIRLVAYPILVHSRTTLFYSSTDEIQVTLRVGKHRKRLGMLQLVVEGVFSVCSLTVTLNMEESGS